jgi:tRNA G18 (ribose-2'-O)-methylase SpoU
MASSSTTSTASHPHHDNNPQVTLLIENPRKSTNWGPLLRCCAAFGIPQIFVVGYDKCSVQGSHGSSKHVELVAYPDHRSAVEAIKALDFELVGLLQGVPEAYDEQGYSVHVKYIMNEETEETSAQVSTRSVEGGAIGNTSTTSSDLAKSFPVHTRPFSHNTCLVVSKKTKGLPLSLAQYCDRFVHIPQQGLASIAPEEEDVDDVEDDSVWLTVEAGLSIVLHEFSAWAGYNYNNKTAINYEGQKYSVQRKSKGSGPDNRQDDKHEERKQRQEELETLAQETEGCLGSLLMDDNSGDY